jgi:hypothetical protein
MPQFVCCDAFGDDEVTVDVQPCSACVAREAYNHLRVLPCVFPVSPCVRRMLVWWLWFPNLPWVPQVFVEDADVPGRYKLAKELRSRPGGEELDFIVTGWRAGPS